MQSRVKKIEKIERIEIPAEQKVIKFEFPEPPRSGDDAAKVENLAKIWQLTYGDYKSFFGGVSGFIHRGETIAVVGV